MKTINFDLNITINQPNPPVDGCFGIYYQLISSKRCIEDPYLENNLTGDAPEWGDNANDVIVMQEGFLTCLTFTSNDTTLVYSGSIQYNDNNPLSLMSCRTTIKFYVLPCCVNNYDCNTLPTSIDHDVLVNSTHYFQDVSSITNKTTCRRYIVCIPQSNVPVLNFPLTVNYNSCGGTNFALCPRFPGDPENTTVLVPLNFNFQISPINGICNSPIIGSDFTDFGTEFCATQTPVITDASASVVNNLVYVIEDINEQKEPITGDCCSKCILYKVSYTETVYPYGSNFTVVSYQDCYGEVKFLRINDGETYCLKAVQGTVRVSFLLTTGIVTLQDFGKPDTLNLNTNCGGITTF